VIVVLSLFALFGMIILVVDVGGLLYARRGMVNASDAAALAAAQSCIGVTENEEAFADQYAVLNADAVVTTGSNITDQVNCHAAQAGYVSVEYTREWPLFFGGVLGFDGSGSVTTAATAHWGPTGTASPIPLVIYEGALQGVHCDIPFVDAGTTCFIWEDNDVGVGGGDFGFLDVEKGWDVGKLDRCNNAGGTPQLRDWIAGSDPVADLDLNYGFATWVCSRRIEGGSNIAWDALEDLIGETRDFPIVGTTPEDEEPPFIGTPQPKYNVIGFAHFEIMDVRMASKLSNPPIDCPVPETATLPFDLIAECAPDGVGAAYVDGSAEPTPGSVVLDVDADGVIQSWSERPTSVTFEYTSLVADCGDNPPPNRSAHCLVLRWNGATIGGKNVGGGANFGIHAVALCDREIGSCIEPG
jgi:hypothetical protein